MNMKNLTDDEKRTLSHLLYLVTHDENVHATVVSHYGVLRIGNPGLCDPQAFKATLETLYTKSCK